MNETTAETTTAETTTATTGIATTKKTRDEATIKRQIFTNAVKYLNDLANKEYERTGVYVAPTQAAISAECKKRYQESLDRKKGKEDVSMYFD